MIDFTFMSTICYLRLFRVYFMEYIFVIVTKIVTFHVMKCKTEVVASVFFFSPKHEIFLPPFKMYFLICSVHDLLVC